MAFHDIFSSSSSSSSSSSDLAFRFPQNRPDSPPTPTFTSKQRSNQTTKYRKLQPSMEELYSPTRRSEIVKGNTKAKNKWQMLTLGPMKFHSEMEMKTIRNRQRRVVDRTVDGGGSGRDPTVIKSWRILHTLSCMASVDIVGQSSPLRLMQDSSY